jgi:hypothetical protein
MGFLLLQKLINVVDQTSAGVYDLELTNRCDISSNWILATARFRCHVQGLIIH